MRMVAFPFASDISPRVLDHCLFCFVKRTKAINRRVLNISFTLFQVTSTSRGEDFHPKIMGLVGQQSALGFFQSAKHAIADD